MIGGATGASVAGAFAIANRALDSRRRAHERRHDLWSPQAIDALLDINHRTGEVIGVLNGGASRYADFDQAVRAVFDKYGRVRPLLPANMVERFLNVFDYAREVHEIDRALLEAKSEFPHLDAPELNSLRATRNAVRLLAEEAQMMFSDELANTLQSTGSGSARRARNQRRQLLWLTRGRIGMWWRIRIRVREAIDTVLDSGKPRPVAWLLRETIVGMRIAEAHGLGENTSETEFTWFVWDLDQTQRSIALWPARSVRPEERLRPALERAREAQQAAAAPGPVGRAERQPREPKASRQRR